MGDEGKGREKRRGRGQEKRRDGKVRRECEIMRNRNMKRIDREKRRGRWMEKTGKEREKRRKW